VTVRTARPLYELMCLLEEDEHRETNLRSALAELFIILEGEPVQRRTIVVFEHFIYQLLITQHPHISTADVEEGVELIRRLYEE